MKWAYKVECSGKDCDYWAEWTFDFPIEVKTGDYWPYYEPECPNCDSPMVLVGWYWWTGEVAKMQRIREADERGSGNSSC